MIELCPSLEMMPGNPEMLFSAIRGTVRAYGRKHSVLSLLSAGMAALSGTNYTSNA